MIFQRTALEGAFVIELERREDERGYFARTWCHREFEAAGLETGLVQCSLSHNRRRRTLRGMHWQAAPHGEVKLVRCVRGAIWYAIVDLRPESPTYMKHLGVELTADNGRALYVPRGFAHGFVTLDDGTDAFYQMSDYYEATATRGARWNDPAFGIEWPVSDPILHPRDAGYPDFTPERAG